MANTEQDWKTYVASEIAALTPLLRDRGYTLDEKQPHTGGERYLMQAVTTTSGRKLVLLGKHKDGTRVVIKVAGDKTGSAELNDERTRREVLAQIKFAYGTFSLPKELWYGKVKGRTIAIHEFITQEKSFVDRPLKEQFTYALDAFKAQEKAHATTYRHERLVRKAFGKTDAAYYRATFDSFIASLAGAKDEKLDALLAEARARLASGSRVIDQYGGFLTHADFVPHNFRIVRGNMYLLDTSSLKFGNKYEGWARFLNFMTLYNPELEGALLDYVRLNRTHEELESLTLMRLFRLGEIIAYYAGTLPKSEGNLRELNEERIRFWTKVLESVLAGAPLPETARTYYRAKRDRLRSPEEKERQKGLH